MLHRSRRPPLPPLLPHLHLLPPPCHPPALSSHCPLCRRTGRARSQMSPYRLGLREKTFDFTPFPPETELLSGRRSRAHLQPPQTFSSRRAGRAGAHKVPETSSAGFFFFYSCKNLIFSLSQSQVPSCVF